MKQVWSKFVWSAWSDDPALRVCSLSAQGLWMRLLCLAAQHDPPGYVALKGKPLSPAELANAVGRSEQEVQPLMDELDRAGVYSRDRHGRIYSRRMVREAALRRKRAKAGYIGALVTHGKPLPSDKLPRQKPGNGQGKSLVKLEANKKEKELDRTELSPGAVPAKPVPEPGVTSAADAVERLRAAMTARAQRPPMSAADRKSRWEQKVFAEAQRTLPTREYQQLLTGYMAGELGAKAEINRISDAMRAREAERERRSTA